MKIFSYVIAGIVIFILLLGLTFGLGVFGLEYKKFFAPKHANIDRTVFENTQSYTHGKIQDLAKYYEEYTKTESKENREAIKSLIVMRFAEFDKSKINSPVLHQFLTNMRGY